MHPAIIADWLVTYGGAEHVLAEFHALWPDAPFFTTVTNRPALGPLAAADIRTTRLQRLYHVTHRHQVLLPWMPRAIEEIDLTGYDCVLSSSHAVAKGIVPPPSALHICYCHTPMRYAWEMEEQYLRDFHIPRWLRPAIRRELTRLRRWDLATAARVDMFIANSSVTQERIARIYARDSIVIPPPVDERFFHHPLQTVNCPPAGRTGKLKTEYFLALGRLVPYKRFDLLIALANELRLPLTIAGGGQDEERLRRLAGPTVTMLGRVDDDALPALYAGASALLFPQEEDAGIVPLEAQACGTPVIAYRAGGAVDSVKDGETGIFFDAQTVDSIRDALRRFEIVRWNHDAIRAHAEAFRQTRFRERVKDAMEGAYEKFKAGRFRRTAT